MRIIEYLNPKWNRSDQRAICVGESPNYWFVVLQIGKNTPMTHIHALLKSETRVVEAEDEEADLSEFL